MFPQQFITNTISPAEMERPYSVMLGIRPSAGARSPSLWNSCLGDTSSMICLDIPNVDSFKIIFSYLESDPLCLGGLITAPYKEIAYESCNISSAFASRPCIANNFYRHNETLSFKGDNTDATGFIMSISKFVNLHLFSHVILLGAGAVSRVIASALLVEGLSLDTISILTRKTKQKEFPVPTPLYTYRQFLESVSTQSLTNVLVINCTSVGDYTNPGSSLIKSVPEIMQIIDYLDVQFFFDCIHNPTETYLSRLFKNRTNGLMMNLYQAAVGFCNVYTGFLLDDVTTLMSSVQRK